MKSCCRENDCAVGKKAINPAVLWTNPTNMIEKYLCNHATVSKKYSFSKSPTFALMFL